MEPNALSNIPHWVWWVGGAGAGILLLMHFMGGGASSASASNTVPVPTDPTTGDPLAWDPSTGSYIDSVTGQPFPSGATAPATSATSSTDSTQSILDVLAQNQQQTAAMFAQEQGALQQQQSFFSQLFSQIAAIQGGVGTTPSLTPVGGGSTNPVGSGTPTVISPSSSTTVPSWLLSYFQVAPWVQSTYVGSGGPEYMNPYYQAGATAPTTGMIPIPVIGQGYTMIPVGGNQNSLSIPSHDVIPGATPAVGPTPPPPLSVSVLSAGPDIYGPSPYPQPYGSHLNAPTTPTPAHPGPAGY